MFPKGKTRGTTKAQGIARDIGNIFYYAHTMINRNLNDLQILNLFVEQENRKVQCFAQSNSMVSSASTTKSFTFM